MSTAIYEFTRADAKNVLSTMLFTTREAMRHCLIAGLEAEGIKVDAIYERFASVEAEDELHGPWTVELHLNEAYHTLGTCRRLAAYTKADKPLFASAKETMQL